MNAEHYETGDKFLGGTTLRSGRYAYHAAEVGGWVIVTTEAVAKLGTMLDQRHDQAYSHWCNQFDVERATPDEVDEIGAAGGKLAVF